MNKKDLSWKTVLSEVVHDNPWFQVRKDSVLRPDGTDGTYYVIDHKPADFRAGIVIVPIVDGNKIVLIRNARYTTGESNWEVPAGSGESGENIERIAERELLEETGYIAESFTQLYTPYRQLVGCATVRGIVVVATGLSRPPKVKRDSMEEEGISEVRAFKMSEIDNLIKNGDIVDAQSIVALHYYKISKTADI